MGAYQSEIIFPERLWQYIPMLEEIEYKVKIFHEDFTEVLTKFIKQWNNQDAKEKFEDMKKLYIIQTSIGETISDININYFPYLDEYDDEDNFVSKIGRLQYIRIQDENRDAFRNWYLYTYHQLEKM